MTRTEARTAVRAATDHDGTSDTQVTDTQLNTWLDLEHKQLCREIAQAAPSVMTKASASQTVASGTETLSLSGITDLDSMVRIERQYGTEWIALDATDGLNPHIGDLNIREEGTDLKLAPLSLAPGTYRIVYLWTPATLAADSGSTGVLLVPAGCEEIITERVAARVRVKLDEDPSFHLANADRIWKAQKSALRRRYGNAAVPGLRLTRRW